jgi:hypothetical protein
MTDAPMISDEVVEAVNKTLLGRWPSVSLSVGTLRAALQAALPLVEAQVLMALANEWSGYPKSSIWHASEVELFLLRRVEAIRAAGGKS